MDLFTGQNLLEFAERFKTARNIWQISSGKQVSFV